MGFFGGLLKAVAPIAASAIPGVGAIAGPAVAAGLGAVSSGDKGNKLLDQATRLKLQEFQASAPLREKARLLAMQGVGPRPDLSTLFADAGNPYNKAGSLVAQLSNGTPNGPIQPPAAPQAQRPRSLLSQLGIQPIARGR